MVDQTPQSLPLLFSFKQVVVGNGFIAGVEMNGRALLETDWVGGRAEAWITGIEPVGISGGGGDRGLAFGEFRKSWTLVVFDLAEQARDFQEFKSLCETFLASNQPNMTQLWTDAVAVVRKSHYVDASLGREDASQKVTFKVLDLANMRPDHNKVENGVQVAA